MSIASIFSAPLRWIGGAARTLIDAITPADLKAKIGLFAHTFAANLAHDAGPAAEKLTHEIVADVWAAMETAAAQLAPQVLAGKMTFADAVAAGVADLKGEATAVVVPALKMAGKQTITNWLPNLITTAMAAASPANPTSQPASSPVASSPG